MFRPHWLKDGVTIPWEMEQEVYVFGSHTSCLNAETLKDELDHKCDDKQKMKEEDKNKSRLEHGMTRF